MTYGRKGAGEDSGTNQVPVDDIQGDSTGSNFLWDWNMGGHRLNYDNPGGFLSQGYNMDSSDYGM